MKAPAVECEQLHPTLTVSDIPEAVDFYVNKLGFVLGFTWGDPPRFAGVNLGSVQLFLSKGPPVPSPNNGAAFFVVGDADELYEFHVANGVEILEPIADREYGMRDYAVRDLYGYHVAFGQNMLNAGPAVPIERVHVPLRIEKRLAGLLEDLARHKNMTVNSCIEEMILHTNEGVGPHTKGTLKHIEELKRKHGIDYDCHASYRFVEK